MKTLKSILVILFLLSSLNAFSVVCRSNISNSGYDIIVVAGQSNAVGSGVARDGRYVFHLTRNDHKIKQLGRYGSHNNQEISGVTRLQHISHSARGTVSPNKYGFAIPFARWYANEHLCGNRKVLIIPAAKGSTSMLAWDHVVDNFLPIRANGMLVSQNDSTFLFSDLRARINYSLRRFPGSRLRTILWQQGEADIITMSGGQKWRIGRYYNSNTRSYNSNAHLNLFRNRLQNFHNILRRQYGNGFTFLMGLVSEDWSILKKKVNTQAPNTLDQYGCLRPQYISRLNISPKRRSINNAIKTVANSHPQTSFIPTNGIQRNSQVINSNNSPADCSLGANIHFSAHGQIILGARYRNRYNHLNP